MSCLGEGYYMKCAGCKNGAQFGNKYCRECLDKARDRAALRYEKIKSERRCKLCPGFAPKGILCSECRIKKKNTHILRRESGLCTVCGKKSAEKGLKCEQCQIADIENRRKRKESQLAAGLCVFCNEQRVTSQLCMVHYLKYTAKTHLKSSEK